MRRALLFVAALTGCGSSQHPPGCGPADEAAIDAWYQARLVEACAAYAPTETPETSCPKWASITAEYKRKNEELYQRCHP
jgi:hypothetical protein